MQFLLIDNYGRSQGVLLFLREVFIVIYNTSPGGCNSFLIGSRNKLNFLNDLTTPYSHIITNDIIVKNDLDVLVMVRILFIVKHKE